MKKLTSLPSHTRLNRLLAAHTRQDPQRLRTQQKGDPTMAGQLLVDGFQALVAPPTQYDGNKERLEQDQAELRRLLEEREWGQAQVAECLSYPYRAAAAYRAYYADRQIPRAYGPDHIINSMSGLLINVIARFESSLGFSVEQQANILRLTIRLLCIRILDGDHYLHFVGLAALLRFMNEISAALVRGTPMSEIKIFLLNRAADGHSMSAQYALLRRARRNLPPSQPLPLHTMDTIDRLLVELGFNRTIRHDLMRECLTGDIQGNVDRLYQAFEQLIPDDTIDVQYIASQLIERLRAHWFFRAAITGDHIGAITEYVTDAHLLWLMFGMMGLPERAPTVTSQAHHLLRIGDGTSGVEELTSDQSLVRATRTGLAIPEDHAEGALVTIADEPINIFALRGNMLRVHAALVHAARGKDELPLVRSITRSLIAIEEDPHSVRNWVPFIPNMDRSNLDIVDFVETLSRSGWPLSFIDDLLRFICANTEERAIKIMSRAVHFLEESRLHRWPWQVQATVISAAIRDRGDRAQRFLALVAGRLERDVDPNKPIEDQLRQLNSLLRRIGIQQGRTQAPRKIAAKAAHTDRPNEPTPKQLESKRPPDRPTVRRRRKHQPK